MIIMCQFFFGKQEILNQTDPHTFDCKFIKRITSCLFVYSSLLFTAREQAYLYIISVPFLVSLFVNAFLFYSLNYKYKYVQIRNANFLVLQYLFGFYLMMFQQTWLVKSD